MSDVIGVVEEVSADRILMRMAEAAPHAVAITSGGPRYFPRINAYVVIPVGLQRIVGQVVQIAIDREREGQRAEFKEPSVGIAVDRRRLVLRPVGTLEDTGIEARPFSLRRGVRVFPSVGDSVLLPTSRQLEGLQSVVDDRRVLDIGQAPLLEDARVMVDLDSLFGEHLAVLGNTGSGKSCSVAGLIRWTLEAMSNTADSPEPRFIVLDPNGEYAAAFKDLGDRALIYTLGGNDGGSRLSIPAWTWNADEWSSALRAAPGVQRPALLSALKILRSSGEAQSETVQVRAARVLHSYEINLRSKVAEGPGALTGYKGAQDTGGFLDVLREDLRKLCDADEGIKQILLPSGRAVRKLMEARHDGRVFTSFAVSSIEEIADLISDARESIGVQPVPKAALEDAPIKFNPDDLPRAIEAVSASDARGSQHVGTMINRLLTMVGDERFRSVAMDDQGIDFSSMMKSLIGGRGGDGAWVVVVDLSLVPPYIVSTIAAVIGRLTLEASIRYRKEHGDAELSTVLVLEEAHRFLSSSEEHGPGERCIATYEQVAREGRKFGSGLVVSSQRPSEVSETILSQCNSYLVHRIVNERDQSLIRRMVPDSLGAMLDELPMLPTGSALALGRCVAVPTLVEVTLLPEKRRPRSESPSFWANWSDRRASKVDAVISEWQSKSERPESASERDQHDEEE